MIMKRVYIAHPLGTGPSRESNRQRAARWVAWAALQDGISPCATWVILSGVWPESPECRDKGLEGDLREIDRCDEVWLCGDRVSPGMEIERQHAIATEKRICDLTTEDGEPPGPFMLGSSVVPAVEPAVKYVDRTLAQWQRAVHQCARDHGFYQNDDGAEIDVLSPLMLSSRIALIHSEISEAGEEHREGRRGMFEVTGKPEGMIVELADVVIRCLDFAASLGLELGAERGEPRLNQGFVEYEPLTIHYEATRALEAVRSGLLRGNDAGSLGYHLEGIIHQCCCCADFYNLDLWQAVSQKHEYNLTRPHKHGRKSL